MPGKYIVIEGPDGTGKTTQAQLLTKKLQTAGIDARYVHEPGETAIGIALETVIKDRDLARSPLTDLLLFTANRIELYEQVIKPAINKGTWVIADRNWLSSIVYQGYASGLTAGKVQDITNAMLPSAYVKPSATILLSLASERRKELLDTRGTSDADYFETKPEAFQRMLIEGYETMADDMSRVNESVSASGSIDEVHRHIVKALKRQGFDIPLP
jgi:dTMP kinase